MSLVPASVLDKPQYVFHPLRAFRRAIHPRLQKEREVVKVDLKWGLPLNVNIAEVIGFTIAHGGVFDLPVSEAIYRLVEPGDRVVDVGANIGYMSSIAAVRAGSTGSVIAFEPHPIVFGLLGENIDGWRDRPGVSPVDARQTALSDRTGSADLVQSELFCMNEGIASFERQDGDSSSRADFTVGLERFEEQIEGDVGLLKIDVEGHEPSVLRGATQALEHGRIRDLIFEDHLEYPSESTKIVEAAGYRLFTLANTLNALALGAPTDGRPAVGWVGPSYLATRDVGRALERLTPHGWRLPGVGPPIPRLRRV